MTNADKPTEQPPDHPPLFINKDKKEGIHFHKGYEGYTIFKTGWRPKTGPRHFSTRWAVSEDTTRVSKEDVLRFFSEIQCNPSWVRR